MLRPQWWLALLLLTAVTPAALGAVPIQDLHDIPVPARMDGENRTATEVRNAILAGCAARGWTAVDESESIVRASLLVRGKHYAEVDIPYSTASYSILYRTSRNLDYNEARRKIHRNYHRWVIKLSGTIQKQFGVSTQVY